MRVFLMICLLAAAAFAGDFARLEIIGFSNDARYLAFEEYGIRDGSGFPYSTIFFVDTSKNSFAAPAVKVSIDKDSASQGAARMRAAALAEKSIRQFRIVRGNLGSLVLSHLLTDLTFEGKQDSARFTEEIGSMYHKGDYELVLKQSEVKVAPCTDYGDDTFVFELLLKDRENDSTRVLQKDSALPTSRGCPMKYGIRSIYVYKGVIAAFLNVYTRGFEGPDLRHLAVTGKFK